MQKKTTKDKKQKSERQPATAESNKKHSTPKAKLKKCKDESYSM